MEGIAREWKRVRLSLYNQEEIRRLEKATSLEGEHTEAGVSDHYEPSVVRACQLWVTLIRYLLCAPKLT